MVARFGDSITVSRAFFNGLQWELRNVSPEAKTAQHWLRSYVQPRCWGWEGSDYGDDGGTTSAWGLKNMDGWLKKLNPEIALVMWGTNDTYQGPNPPQYTENLRQIIQKCLDNGTVPILYTIPPVASQAGDEKKTKHVESFVEAARLVAAEKKVPLIDYYAEIMKRQPENFDKTLMGDNLHPSAPQKYSNDFSEEALKNHGYGLRTYLTLMKMYEVQQKVFSQVKPASTDAGGQRQAR